jgi:DNA repair exonuclease SbcCD ATPase subunit
MRCQHCEKPATFHITELTEPTGPVIVHLCEEHARVYLSQESNDSPTNALASMLAKQLKLEQTAEQLAKLDKKTCPVCGTSFAEFRLVKLDELARKCGEWLRGSGPESDIVISSRIRLARNLAEFPFVRKCTDQDRAQVERQLRERIQQVEQWASWPMSMSPHSTTSIASSWWNVN